jgi:hypothetical protein
MSNQLADKMAAALRKAIETTYSDSLSAEWTALLAAYEAAKPAPAERSQLAHDLWVAACAGPGDSIEDRLNRIQAVIDAHEAAKPEPSSYRVGAGYFSKFESIPAALRDEAVAQFTAPAAPAEPAPDLLATRLAVAEEMAAQYAAQLDQVREQKNGAYLERNRCVALIARMALALGQRAGVARTAIEGWSEDWHGCVYIDLPAGQASWHYHDSQASLFDGLPAYKGAWDGHSTPEKYERVAASYVAPVAPAPAPEALNLADPAVQKRLAAQWGYAPAQAGAKPAPAGLVLVPVEPTIEMLNAGRLKIDFDRTGQNTFYLEHPSHREVYDKAGALVPDAFGGTTIKEDMQDAWDAMLATAPAAPAPEADLSHATLAGLILAHMGYGTAPSMEPGADAGRDVLAEKLAGWIPAQAQQADEPTDMLDRAAAWAKDAACKEDYFGRKWKAEFLDALADFVTTKAKPEAQPLDKSTLFEIEDRFARAIHPGEHFAGPVSVRDYRGFSAAVQAACAEQWGVKLAGIGASGEASNG